MVYNKKAKVKVLFLLKILQEETDAQQGLTMTQIINKLAEYGIPAERKSVYADIKALREFDVDVRTYQRNPVQYAIEQRAFSLEELMLMVDAIQSCRSITEHQANMLIINIKQLATTRQQALLDRRIHVEGRIKTKSESVLATVDTIHKALRLHCKMEFSYRKMGPDGKYHETREGRKHLVTPMSISYDDGFYYLSAWDEKHEGIVQYRLDRMIRLKVLEDQRATRNDEINHFRYDNNKAAMFGRFGGQELVATLATNPDKCVIITDRFGKAAEFLPFDGSEARARVKVYKSEQFFGWVASMGKAVRIVAPQALVDEYRAYLQFLLED